MASKIDIRDSLSYSQGILSHEDLQDSLGDQQYKHQHSVDFLKDKYCLFAVLNENGSNFPMISLKS